MAIENIPVNSGTGPAIAVDSVGGVSYQIVKIMQGGDGSTDGLSSTLAISGTTTAIAAGTQTVTGTISVSSVTSTIVATMAGTITVTGGGGGQQYTDATLVGVTGTGTLMFGVSNNTARSVLIHTTGGLIIATGGGGGIQYGQGATVNATGTGSIAMGMAASTAQAILLHTTGGIIIGGGAGAGIQYPVNDTSMFATGTGTLVLGMQSGATTARGLALTTTGGLANVQLVATISTLLGTVAVSGAGGGAQYPTASTAMGATGTGNIMLGIQGTTAFAIAITSSGQQLVSVANTVTITGTVGALMLQKLDSTNDSVTATVSNLYMYSAATTAMGSTAQGVIAMGMQTGSTAGQPIAVSTTGAQYVLFPSVPTITGTVGVAGTVTITGSASISGTGSVTVVNAPTVTATISNTLFLTQPSTASNLSGFNLLTTSNNAIIITSGAYTIYVTDLWLSVDGPMNVTLFSAATTKGQFYFATKGGTIIACQTPLKLNSNQSLTVTPSSSGLCGVTAIGFSTV